MTTDVSLNVFSIYADRRGAKLTAQVCNSLKRKLGAQFHLHQHEWNAELLKSAKLRALAAREAMDADLVILALPEAADLSPELNDWFHLWRNRPRSSPAALVALLEKDANVSGGALHRKLQAFAASTRMDYFWQPVYESRTSRRERETDELSAPFASYEQGVPLRLNHAGTRTCA